MWFAARKDPSRSYTSPRVLTTTGKHHTKDGVPAGVQTSGDDEAALLERLRGGDEAAFSAIYFAHVSALVRFAYSYVKSTAAAEDVVEDTFVHLWERRGSLAPRFGIRAYLFAAVHHRVQHAIRGEGRRARMMDRLAAAISEDVADLSAVECELDGAELGVRLRQAVDSLPEDRRRLIALRWYEELSIPEMAEILGLSPGAVKQRLLRTLDTLRQLLNKNEKR